MESFGLSEEQIEKFREEGIDEEAFELLDDETIANIFPKAGPRLIFKKKYSEYKSKQLTVLAEICPNLPSPSYSSLSSDTVTIESNDTIEIDVHDEDWVELCKLPMQQENLPIEQHLDKRKSDSILEDTPNKKIMLNDVFEGGFDNILKNTIDGKIVLMRKFNLNNDCRQRLVKEIINYLIGKLGVDGVKTFMLNYCAEEIPKIFPNEVKETYYIPYSPKSSTSLRHAAKGKLWSRFVNVRNAIKTAESALQKNHKKTPPKDYPNKDTELEILSSIIEPKEKVLTLWIDTYQQRRSILRSSSLTVDELFERYAALATNLGPDLIESDFHSRFSDNGDIIYTKFPVLANAILAEAQSRKISVVSDDVDPLLKAILTLPYLFTPVTLKNKRKSGNWRPSRSEISESFFLHIEKYEELQEKKSNRLEKLKQCNFTLQPFGVICGPLDKVTKYLIVINDITYTFDSLIRSVDILYKAFHALDIQYPYEAQHIWQLIEEVIYGMKQSPSSSSVTALISDLKKYM